MNGAGTGGPGRRVRWGGLGLILLLALAVRLYVSARIWTPNLDTATVGDMALNILKGERPIFFYGQSYMGSLEAYLAAALFSVFGARDLTLSLSPMLFSLAWIAANYLLFRDLFGRPAGLAAALCLAVPGWDILWYSIGSYGGYPAALALGAGSLWLAFRIAAGNLSPRAQWTYVLVLGGLAGLGLWTNYVCGVYLLAAILLLLVYFVRIRFAPAVLMKFVVGGLTFLAGVWPVLISIRAEHGTGHLAEWNFAADRLRENLNIFRHESLPDLMTWPIERFRALNIAMGWCAAVAGLLYGWRVVTARNRADRAAALWPAGFCGLFLLLYLPHRLAHLGALRYLLPLAGMWPCALFAVPVSLTRRRGRLAAWVLLGLWLGANLAGALIISRERAPERVDRVAARDRVVEKARRAGLRNVFMVGGNIFGYQGQILDFGARNQIKFISVTDERHAPSAQAAETDSGAGLACEADNVDSVAAALQQLRVGYRFIEDPWISIFHKLDFSRARDRCVPVAELAIRYTGEVEGAPGALTDRVRETEARGTYASACGLVLDLGRVRRLDRLWLTAADWHQYGLPSGYEISVSTNGQEFEVIDQVDSRISVAYTCGAGVYLKGYFGVQEIRWPPAPARFVRCRFTRGQRDLKRWSLNEVFVFEQEPGPPGNLDEEVAAMVRQIHDRGIDFTVADRWLSARLWEALAPGPAGPPAFPRFNSRHKPSLLSRRIEPRPGLAVAVAGSLADEAERLLREVYAGSVAWERLDFSEYSLLVFQRAGRPVTEDLALLWNGHALLKTWNPPGDVY